MSRARSWTFWGRSTLAWRRWRAMGSSWRRGPGRGSATPSVETAAHSLAQTVVGRPLPTARALRTAACRRNSSRSSAGLQTETLHLVPHFNAVDFRRRRAAIPPRPERPRGRAGARSTSSARRASPGEGRIGIRAKSSQCASMLDDVIQMCTYMYTYMYVHTAVLHVPVQVHVHMYM